MRYEIVNDYKDVSTVNIGQSGRCNWYYRTTVFLFHDINIFVLPYTCTVTKSYQIIPFS